MRHYKILVATCYFICASFTVSGDKITAPRQQPDADQLERLYTLAKVYGYIRYFYPADEAAALDWKQFAHVAAQKACISGKTTFVKDLQDLFTPIAPGIVISQVNQRADNKSMPLPVGVLPVYWQHLGDGKNTVGYPYKSMRVNRAARVLPESPNDFFTIRQAISLGDISGKRVRLSVDFQADPFYNGRPAVILSIKEKGKDVQGTSSEGQPLAISKWIRHSVEKLVPDSVERAFLIVQNIGMSGSLLVDNLTLEVWEDGKWKKIRSSGFANESVKDLQTDWRPAGPNHEFSFAEKNGGRYLRIFRTEGRLQYIDPLFSKQPDSLLHTYAIGSGLNLALHHVLYRDSTGTLPKADPRALQLLNNTVNGLDAGLLSADNLYTRLANVVLVWNVIQHFHPMLRGSSIDWDAKLRRALKQCFADDGFAAHRRTLSQLVDGLKDSHMTFYYPTTVKEDFYPAFGWEWIEDHLVITASADTIPLQAGDVILSVNGKSAVSFWQTQRSCVIGANLYRKDAKAAKESLTGKKGEKLVLRIKRSGRTEEISVYKNLSEFAHTQLLNANSKEAFRQPSPGVYYVDLTRMNWETLKRHLPEMTTAKALIFDLRGYPQWNTIQIIGHFTHEPVAWMQYATPQIVYPDGKDWLYYKAPPDTIYPKTPFLSTRKIFLTNAAALSYAEDFMELIKENHFATIVGEPTSGITGNTNNMYLLGGLYFPWTGMLVTKTDGTAFNGNGIQPDHLVHKKIADVKQQKDGQLNYVLQHLLGLP